MDGRALKGGVMKSIYYHITPSKNMNFIMREGLVLPYSFTKNLEPSEEEEYLRIYLFRDKSEALESARNSSQINKFSYNLLEVHLPGNIRVYPDRMSSSFDEGSVFVKKDIKPQFILNLGRVD